MTPSTGRSGQKTTALRDMKADDLEAVHGLTLALKWPHRLEDWRFMLMLGAGLVACDETGTVIGSVMWWLYGADAATLGMVIVSDSQQGKGLGRRLMQAGMERLARRTVLLNATPAGLPLYEKLGYATTGAAEQRQGSAGAIPTVALKPETRLRPVGRNDGPLLTACDRAATGLDRGPLLDALAGIGEVIALDQAGEIVGYAFCRRFGRGLVIGPVVAPSQDGAKALIAHWIGSKTGQFVRLDIPVESGLSAWLDEIGLPRVDTVACMAAGLQRPLPDEGVRRFALCSQALG
ncbi:MAG: GNAT family N-acetyltransferase [Janthinobacterium lividum]